MNDAVKPWPDNWPRWVNSIHVHMLGLATGVIAALTAVSLILLYVFSPPQLSPVSVYELSRIVEARPIVRPVGEIERSFSRDAPAPSHPAERVVSQLLAQRLGLSPDLVRVKLDQDLERVSLITREAKLYGAAANPLIVGSFSVAIRTEGGWNLFARQSLGLFNVWSITGWNVVLAGSLFVLPLTLWFSAHLARPIEAFAASAQQLGGGRTVEPVSIAGPTEIRLAAQSLNDMQARIIGFVRERTTLMGAIAHDLRAPLSRLHFHLTAAPAELRGAAEAEIAEMERLIAVVLDFVENETRAPVREPLDLAMLVEGIADDYADVGKDVRIVATEPMTTTGDPLLLKRLFGNVIDNAIKYGASAEIGIRRHGTMGIVEVRDHGPGMSEEELARAFEPFFRGEPSRNPDTGGVGLGLSIVKSAVDAHGGSVEFANAEDGGLVTRVTLPLRLQEPGRRQVRGA